MLSIVSGLLQSAATGRSFLLHATAAKSALEEKDFMQLAYSVWRIKLFVGSATAARKGWRNECAGFGVKNSDEGRELYRQKGRVLTQIQKTELESQIKSYVNEASGD
ncbi:hypothetical protein Tco_0409073 [Tanacetum coccineum]